MEKRTIESKKSPICEGENAVATGWGGNRGLGATSCHPSCPRLVLVALRGTTKDTERASKAYKKHATHSVYSLGIFLCFSEIPVCGSLRARTTCALSGPDTHFYKSTFYRETGHTVVLLLRAVCACRFCAFLVLFFPFQKTSATPASMSMIFLKPEPPPSMFLTWWCPKRKKMIDSPSKVVASRFLAV